MATLTELFALVRTQTQTTEVELPNATILPWLQQALDRTLSAYTNWPFLETQWTVTQVAGDTFAALPADAHYPGIVSLRDSRGLRLRLVNQETAEEVYHSGGSYPVEFSIWGDAINLWPQAVFADDQDYTLRGFRLAGSLLTAAASDSPDCDVRLHMPLAHYATALAYAQQEDEVLEDKYMQRWQRDVELAAGAIMEPARHRQVMMGPHYRMTRPGFPFVIDTGGL